MRTRFGLTTRPQQGVWRGGQREGEGRGQRRALAAATGQVESTADQLKMRLLMISSKTDRGQLLFKEKVYSPLDEYQKKEEIEVRELVEKLIHMNEQVDDTEARYHLHDGTWELVFATKQLFRASPFFMAISESMEVSKSREGEWVI